MLFRFPTLPTSDSLAEYSCAPCAWIDAEGLVIVLEDQAHVRIRALCGSSKQQVVVVRVDGSRATASRRIDCAPDQSFCSIPSGAPLASDPAAWAGRLASYRRPG